MWEFNLIVTQAGSTARYFHLLQELGPLGEFHKTEFHGVILGRVEDRRQFLEEVLEARRRGELPDLGRVVPIDRVFVFQTDNFLGRLQQAALPYLDDLAGRRFYFRLERRGLKGQIVSPEIDRSIDAFILENLALAGKQAQIDFESPEAVLVAETVGDRCGVGLLTPADLERYDFVRVP